LKFSDILIAVASLAVIFLFLAVILGYFMTPAMGWDWGPAVSSFGSVLISGLIVGAIFSKKIWEEAGIKTIAKIIVLGAVLSMLYYAAAIPSQGDWTPYVKETFQNTHPGTTLTTSEWFSVEVAALGQEIAINVFFLIVLGFTGLYVGSMLRKSRNSQE